MVPALLYQRQHNFIYPTGVLIQPRKLCHQLLSEDNVYSPLNLSTLEKVSEVTLETVLLFVTLRYLLFFNKNALIAFTLPASFASASEAVWPQLLS